MNLICWHPKAGLFGKYTHRMRDLGADCGPNAVFFEQHPNRNIDGTLILEV